jgi:transcription elongation GreA/GreB family factor
MGERVYYVSYVGLQRLINQRKAVEEDVVDTQRKIGETTNLDNDLRENPEYMELAVHASTTLPRKLIAINDILAKCKMFEDGYKNKKDFTTISIGDKITVQKDNAIYTYIIGGYGDSDIEKGIIAYNTLLGKAFLGKKLNDIVTVDLPDKKAKYEILLIQRGFPVTE